MLKEGRRLLFDWDHRNNSFRGGRFLGMHTQPNTTPIDEGYDDIPPMLIPADAPFPDYTTWTDARRAEFAFRLLTSVASSHAHAIIQRIQPLLLCDILVAIPPELACHILTLVSVKDIARIAKVSPTWHRFALDPRVWRGLYLGKGWSVDDAAIRRWVRGEDPDLLLSLANTSPPIGTASSSRRSSMYNRRNSIASNASSLLRTPIASAVQPSSGFGIYSPQYPSTGPSPELSAALIAQGYSSPSQFWNTAQLLDLMMADAAVHPSPRTPLQPHSTLYSPNAPPSASLDVIPESSTGDIEGIIANINSSVPSIHLPSQISLTSLTYSQGGHNTDTSGSSLAPPSFGSRTNLTGSINSSMWSLGSRANESISAFNLDPHIDYSQQSPMPRIDWRHLYAQRSKLERAWEKTYSPTTVSEFALDASCPRMTPPVRQLKGHTDGIYTLQHDQDKVISGSRDRSVRVWDIKTGKCREVLTHAHEGSILCLQFDADQMHGRSELLTGGSDRKIVAWQYRDLGSGIYGHVPMYAWHAHDESVLNIRMDDKVIVTCGKDRALRVWRRQTPEEVLDVPVLHDDEQSMEILSMRESMDAMRLGRPRSQENMASRVLHVKDVPMVSREPLRAMSGHRVAINAVQIAAPLAITVSGDRSIRIWDLETGQCMRTMEGHERGIACVEWDGRIAFTGSSDRTVRIWDTRSPGANAAIGCITGHDDLVRTLAWDGGVRLVSGCYDTTIRIFDVRKITRAIHRVENPTQPWSFLVHDESIGGGLKDVKTLGRLTGHDNRVLKVTMDCQRVVSCSQDTMIHVWDFGRDVDTRFMR